MFTPLWHRDHMAFFEIAATLITPDNDPSRWVAEKIGMRQEGQAVHAGLPHLVYRALLI